MPPKAGVSKIVRLRLPTSTSPNMPRPNSPKVGNDLHRIPNKEAKKEGEGLLATGGKAIETPISLSSDKKDEDEEDEDEEDFDEEDYDEENEDEEYYDDEEYGEYRILTLLYNYPSWRAKLLKRNIFNADGTRVKSADDKTSSPLKRKTEEIDMGPYKRERIMASFGKVVTLIVGKSATKFFAHKNMLCAASPFFEAACKLEWQSADGCVITLPEAHPEAVKMLLSWVYENDICVAIHHFFRDMDRLDSGSGLLLKLYILGDKFQMPALQNDVIDVLNDSFLRQEGYGWQFMNYACKETSETDPLRLFLVNFAICEWSPDKLESYKTHLCPEFTHSMAVKLLKCRSKEETIVSIKELPKETFCTLFHRHESSFGEKCKSSKFLRFAGLRSLQ